jgi:hypothetical protein
MGVGRSDSMCVYLPVKLSSGHVSLLEHAQYAPQFGRMFPTAAQFAVVSRLDNLLPQRGDV